MPQKKKSSPRSRPAPPYRLRRSPVHGMGVFATRPIRKGARIIEYVGERISHDEADRRHSEKEDNDGHTFLFTVDKKVTIDAGVDGNDARFINHSCDPNCEAIIEDSRLFIESIRAIKVGEELAYDYNIGRDPSDPPELDQVFGCRCGSATCRGTMLSPRKKPASRKKKTAKKTAARKPKPKTTARKPKTTARKPKTTPPPASRRAKKPGKTGSTRRAA